jgi:hypothetical protein
MLPDTPQWRRLQKASEAAIEQAGGKPDEWPWLVENLAGTLDALSHKHKAEGEQLKKSELRKELYGFFEKAKAIDRALSKISVLEFINLESNDGLADIGAVICSLRRYADAAKKAAENIPTTAGATRAKTADNLLGARPWCALVVRELWLICQGCYPGDTNPHAQTAASSLWGAALGRKPKIHVESWAPHLTKARKCKDWQADFIRMTLRLRPVDLTSIYNESI